MLFKAKTKYASKYKALFELLFNNMTTVCFTINHEGIFLKTTTEQGITFDISLPKDNFEEYVFENTEALYIGLGNQVKQFFKTVKNKTVVEFIIENPFVFEIKVTSLDGNCVSVLEANIANVQNIASTDLKEYSVKPVSVFNTNFSKMCRSFKTPTFYLSKTNGQLEFGCMMTDIYKKTYKFGPQDPSDTSLFYNQYRTDQFIRIIKIASFVSNQIMVYSEQHLPLLFESCCEIGVIKTYIESTVD